MGKTYKIRDSASGDLVSYYSDVITPSFAPNYIAQLIKNGILGVRYRLSVLNPDETVKYTIPEEDIIAEGSFNENYQNGQRRAVSFSLFNETGKYTPSINGLWTGTKFSFDVGIELLNGGVAWFKKGIYVVSSANPTNEPSNRRVSVEMGDKFSTLEGASGVLNMSYTIPVGEEIEDVITDLFKLPMGNGLQYDPKSIIYHSSFKGKKTQATITKEAGSNLGAIILELCVQLNAECFYDVEGHLNIVPINDVTNDVDKPIIDQLYAQDGDFTSDNLSFNFNEIINKVYVMGASVNGNTYRGEAENNDPSSPLCYQRIGYRVATPINDTNITSDILAQDRADYELRNKLILKSTVSIQTPLNPNYLVNNLIGLTDDFYGLQQEKFLIQSISYSLDYSGMMTVSLASTNNLPFFTSRR